MVNRKRRITILLAIAFIFITLFLVWGLNTNNYEYNLSLRIPKVMGIIIAGAAIATASILFQSITQNRIITPSIIGLDSLYSAVQTFVVFTFGASSIFMTSKPINFLVTSIIMISLSMILFKVVLKKSNNNIFFLLLVGTVIGTVFKSLSSFMQVLIDPNEFDKLLSKLYASFNIVNTQILFLAIIIIVIVFAFIYDDLKKLDVVALGRDEAINLGINYDKFTKKILVIVAILVSISTALVGPITFLGILVVNLTFAIINSYKHTELITVAILISIIALVGGQFFVERVFNFSTTISIIINFIGGIYFIRLLLKEGKL
ncbi:iron chelate uptake ABC transporter family permease subunit [Clostridium sp.]|uniref:iron chelate uptake ABC transporter family permease subunit n=1 Tax=Clostridium sp. TaxID=1506 RepID=UPI002605D499|nr:iron chelate uptake ABC transporter family permease subunit [Clostridium sp.]